MLKKIYISRNYPDKYTASGKAKIDAEEIIESIGFNNIGFRQSSYALKSIKAYARLVLSMILTFFRLPKNAVIFIQHPQSKNDDFIKIAKSRHNKIITLVHDLNCLRDWDDSRERSILNNSDILIVHTQAMKEWLIEHNIGNQYVILEIFDYLHGTLVPDNRMNKYRIAFAGNLGKSSFIDKLGFDNIIINLYGVGIEKRKLGKGVVYKGCFPSDKLAENMEADFGLVWDGESIHTCTGQLGEYLRLIAPHKLSMYLSGGLPVIVWKDSAMAKYVVDNKLGIAIDNLENLEQYLSNISSEEYASIKRNVLKVSQKLNSGYYLNQALQKALRLL